MQPAVWSPMLEEPEFERLASFIQGSVGIKMPPHKRGLLELRLGKRIRALGLNSFAEYCAHVFDSGDRVAERLELIDAVTTNKTDFFREPEHFERLAAEVLPELLDRRDDPGRPLRVWSAGCSSGEEPYTLAMVLAEFSESSDASVPQPAFIATDLSLAMLRTAVRGVYLKDRVASVPDPLLRKYFLKGKGESENLVRVVAHLRESVDFLRMNLVEEYPFREMFDIIFCRNVLIYFERELQVEILSRMCDMLEDGGYLFVGHSETLHGMDLPLEHRGPTVYRREARR